MSHGRVHGRERRAPPGHDASRELVNRPAMTSLPLLLMLAGCASERLGPKGYDDVADTSSRVDSSVDTGDDSAVAPPEDLTLRALPRLPGAEVPATFRAVRAHVCPDASQREAQGPWLESPPPGWDAQPGGVEGETAGWGVAVADVDRNGTLDIYLPHFGPDQLFLRGHDGSVTDASDRLPGLSDPSFGATPVDAEGDGDIDIAVANEGGNVLLLNDGTGRFSAVADSTFAGQAGVERAHHFSWRDLDGDGRLDAFVPTFYHLGGSAPDENLLLRATGRLRWERVQGRAGAEGVGLEVSPANAGGLVDLDGDGNLDVYVISDKPGEGFRSGARFGDGLGGFVAAESDGLDVAVQGMGVGLGDVNGDGVLDAAVTGWDELALLVSVAGADEAGVARERVWANAAMARGVVTGGVAVVGWAAHLADLEIDTDLDLLVAYGPDYSPDGSLGRGPRANPVRQPIVVYSNDGGVFARDDALQPGAPGNHRGMVVTDLNGDGWLDVVARDLAAGPARMHLARCGRARAVELKLVPRSTNPEAVGARVWMQLPDGRVLLRDALVGAEGIASGASPTLHVGVGDAAAVDVLVRWPDGGWSRTDNLATGTTVVVVREVAPSPRPSPAR